MKKFIGYAGAIVLGLSLMGCLGKEDSPSEAPANVTVEAGENAVTLRWSQESSRDYWIYYKEGSSVALHDSGTVIVMNATSPKVITGLTNDTAYAFVMAASQNGSAVGPSSESVSTTPRIAGASWVANSPLGSNALRALAVGTVDSTTTVVAVGDSGSIYTGAYKYTNANAADWVVASNQPTIQSLKGAVHDGSQFVAVGTAGTVVSSSDGATWTLKNTVSLNGAPVQLNGITHGGVYVAVGDGGTIMTSSDLVTWTQASSGTGNALYGITILNGYYFVVGANGTLLTSSDGSTWTAHTTNTGVALRGVNYAASTYVAVGDNGTVLTSSDGTTWAAQASGTTQNLNSIIYGTRFMVVGDNGTVIHSTDALTWTTATSGTTASLYSLLIGSSPTLYLAVGAAGSNLVAK